MITTSCRNLNKTLSQAQGKYFENIQQKILIHIFQDYQERIADQSFKEYHTLLKLEDN